MNALFLTDGYKTGHHQQYPKGTEYVYSNWTPRSNKHAPQGCDSVLNFGAQIVLKYIVKFFDEDFFSKSKEDVCAEIKRELSIYLNTDYDSSHFEALHDLGYLPILVKGLPEGVEVPIGVPTLTIVNTHPDFGWITNYLETILSNLLWQPMTSATIALLYRRILTKWAMITDEHNIDFVAFQGHDFSMRGMSGLTSVILSGLGHATSFKGSDSLPVIYAARKFYYAKNFVVGSVNATEHSVMCAGSKIGEIETFKRLLKIYPTGILSIVSDTWDLWKVLTEYLPSIKDDILSRDGKLVIRPDSGDPVDILCGTLRDIGGETPERKGVIEILWDVFGGRVNNQGYKVLNDKIGAIYGDSITPERARQICERLAEKDFASTNVVFGIGSFTYQYNTRDTFGFAMKATSVVVNGERRDIFKDPVTSDGTKKSAKGLLYVQHNEYNMDYELIDQVDEQTEQLGELKPILVDGNFLNKVTLEEIRERVNNLVNPLKLV